MPRATAVEISTHASVLEWRTRQANAPILLDRQKVDKRTRSKWSRVLRYSAE
jgi:hypothetical protein